MFEQQLQAIITGDPLRMRILECVRSLQLADAWVAAGFVRSCVWDHLHQRTPSPLPPDIDVIWHDPDDIDEQRDSRLQAALEVVHGGVNWSVKNQARMHRRNGDAPYLSAIHAMTFWPETATAVAVRLDAGGAIEVAAPLGLDDLFALRVRPTARFLGEKKPQYLERIRRRQWQATWPLLTIQCLDEACERECVPCLNSTA